MELQIQDLVTSIKNEGIETAKAEAAKIIAEAKEKADSIIAEAQEKADKLFDDKSREIEILRQSASVSAQQAKRDAVISFKQEVNDQYKKLLAQNTGRVMKDETLAKLIECVISDGDVKNLAVELNEVSDSLKAQLADKIADGLEIRPVKTARKGFKVVMKDGSGFIDCTDDEIAEMLSPFMGQINL